MVEVRWRCEPRGKWTAGLRLWQLLQLAIILRGLVTSRRATPGPTIWWTTEVPYSTYKRCPQMLPPLENLEGVLVQGTNQWRCYEFLWIPKGENSTDTSQFRSILLLSVKSKIFFSMLSWQLTEFLDRYICAEACDCVNTWLPGKHWCGHTTHQGVWN